MNITSAAGAAAVSDLTYHENVIFDSTEASMSLAALAAASTSALAAAESSAAAAGATASSITDIGNPQDDDTTDVEESVSIVDGNANCQQQQSIQIRMSSIAGFSMSDSFRQRAVSKMYDNNNCEYENGQPRQFHNGSVSSTPSGPISPSEETLVRNQIGGVVCAANGVPEKRRRKPPQRWDQEEESKFLYALETFGRDWKKCAEHIGSRDPDAIRSHAQKYFIKLWYNQQPLPNKVLETGSGYTLSGRPLDPESASVKKYCMSKQKKTDEKETEGKPAAKPAPCPKNAGSKRKSPEPLLVSSSSVEGMPIRRSALEVQLPGLRSAPNQPKINATPIVTASQSYTQSLTVNQSQDEGLPTFEGNYPKFIENDEGQRTSRRLKRASSGSCDDPANPDSCQGRLKIPKKMDESIVWLHQSTESEPPIEKLPITMQELPSEPTSTEQLSQLYVDFDVTQPPFAVHLSEEALIITDIHAHLADSQVYGLLAGSWDHDSKDFAILKAVPLPSRTLVKENVVAIAEAAHALDMFILGVYISSWSSHTLPSLADSKLFDAVCSFRGYHESIPFVQMIVGPHVPHGRSAVTIFSKFSASHTPLIMLNVEIIKTATLSSLNLAVDNLRNIAGEITSERLDFLKRSLESRVTHTSMIALLDRLRHQEEDTQIVVKSQN